MCLKCLKISHGVGFYLCSFSAAKLMIVYFSYKSFVIFGEKHYICMVKQNVSTVRALLLSRKQNEH